MHFWSHVCLWLMICKNHSTLLIFLSNYSWKNMYISENMAYIRLDSSFKSDFMTGIEGIQEPWSTKAKFGSFNFDLWIHDNMPTVFRHMKVSQRCFNAFLMMLTLYLALITYVAYRALYTLSHLTLWVIYDIGAFIICILSVGSRGS